MTELQISLPESMKTLVDEQVASGGYPTASEYLQVLIRDAQVGARTRGEIDAMLVEALESGPPTPVTQKTWDQVEREGVSRLRNSEVP